MGDALLLFNISRPQRLTELSNVTQMASRTLAGNSRSSVVEVPGLRNATLPGFFCPASLLFLLWSLGFSAVSGFGSPAAWAALEDVSVVRHSPQSYGHPQRTGVLYTAACSGGLRNTSRHFR